MPTRSSACIAISLSAAGQSPRVDRHAGTLDSRPISTLLSTVVRSARLKVWKIIPMFDRTSRNVAAEAPTTSMSLTFTDPSVAGTSPLRARSKVDLPAPDSPTTTTNSPSSIVRSTLRRACTPPRYVTETFSSWIMVVVGRPLDQPGGSVIPSSVAASRDDVEVALDRRTDVGPAVDLVEDHFALLGIEECRNGVVDRRLQRVRQLAADRHDVVRNLAG